MVGWACRLWACCSCLHPPLRNGAQLLSPLFALAACASSTPGLCTGGAAWPCIWPCMAATLHPVPPPCPAQAVMQEYQDIRLAFGESDEYSFVFAKDCQLYGEARGCREMRPAGSAAALACAAACRLVSPHHQPLNAPPAFCAPVPTPGRRASKLVSLVTSCFTGTYVRRWAAHFPDTPLAATPMFDARAVLYPSDQTLRDYLSWRQADTHINNLVGGVESLLRGWREPTGRLALPGVQLPLRLEYCLWPPCTELCCAETQPATVARPPPSLPMSSTTPASGRWSNRGRPRRRRMRSCGWVQRYCGWYHFRHAGL